MIRLRTASRMVITASLLLGASTFTLASQRYVLRSSPSRQSLSRIQQSLERGSSFPVSPLMASRPTETPLMIADHYDIYDPDDPDTRGSNSPSFSAIDPKSSQAVEIARKYRGTRYLWGGTTSRGFDCSGFVRYVYSRLGHQLPRTASEQFHVGRKICAKDLRPGDVLFFHTSRRGVSHVGIYIGDQKFIHAANPRKGVIVSDLSGYYGHRLVGARRIS